MSGTLRLPVVWLEFIVGSNAVAVAMGVDSRKRMTIFGSGRRVGELGSTQALEETLNIVVHKWCLVLGVVANRLFSVESGN